MNTEEKMRRVGPPRGVIGCLTAGFEAVGRNLLVVTLPVALDLFLWLGPRVSVGPLVQSFAGLLRVQSPADADAVNQVAQATELLEQFGTQFNLVSVVSGIPMLQIPSLLARRASGGGSPLGDPRVFSLSSLLALIPWWGVLVMVGLVLGFLYLNEIAHQVKMSAVGSTGDRAEAREEGNIREGSSARTGPWKFFRFGLFSLGLLLTGSVVVPLWLFIVALGTVIAQPLGILIWVAGVGFIGYAALHLIFVVPSLLVGERPLLRAVGESILLTHANLWSVFGLIILALVIYEGLGYAWSLPVNDSWALLVGIVGNAFVATGLTSAAFVFYRDRLALARRLSLLDD
jgi:hypothetical protein